MANDVKASTVEVVDASGKVVLHIRNDGGLLQYNGGIVNSIFTQGSLMLGQNLGVGDAGGFQNLTASVLLTVTSDGGVIHVSGAQGISGGQVQIAGNGPRGAVTSIAPGNVELQSDGKPIIMLLNNGQIVCQDLSCGNEILLDGHTGQIRLLNVQSRFVQVTNSNNTQSIQLNGDTQKISCMDVELFNADCAEEFDVQEGSTVDAGSVVILGDEGTVTECREEYDTRVAGVISGAGSYRPGLLLDRKSTAAARVPVTLMGKVFCKVDAAKAPVRPGDLLVSSPLPGHAMRACDRSRLPGSVIGKALGCLPKETGLLPILLALG